MNQRAATGLIALSLMAALSPPQAAGNMRTREEDAPPAFYAAAPEEAKIVLAHFSEIYNTPGHNAPAAALLAAGAALSGQSARVLMKLFAQVRELPDPPSYNDAAEIAAASAISGKMPEQLLKEVAESFRFDDVEYRSRPYFTTEAAIAGAPLKRFREVYRSVVAIPEAPVNAEALATLAGAVVESGRTADDLVKLYRVFGEVDGPFIWPKPSAELAAATAITGRSTSSMLTLFFRLHGLPGLDTRSYELARLARAAAVSTYGNQRKKALANPPKRLEPGQAGAAEQEFKFNWDNR